MHETPSAPFEVLNPAAAFGRCRQALFDFDGTLSVVRAGWEQVMVPMMVETLAGREGDPDGSILRQVESYVDASTGVQTILQMQWLAQAVASRRGAASARSPQDYKRVYTQRLLEPVGERLGRLARGEVTRDELMIAGAEEVVRALADRGLTLYLASGTDREDVRHEAAALGLARYFGGGVFGALGSVEEYSKAQVIADILDTMQIEGPELLVVGDGPVEIREGKARGAITVGVASDEARRCGLNRHKRTRLVHAGADVIVADFTQPGPLLRLLLPR